MYHVRKATKAPGKKTITGPAMCESRRKLASYLGKHGVLLAEMPEALQERIETGPWPVALPSPVAEIEFYVTRVLKVDGGPKLTKDQINTLYGY